jgi:ribose transport system permease protein
MKSFSFPAWTWSFVFAALVLIGILAVTGRGIAGTLSLALSLAPYLVLVGLGQMLVITAGPGNIDVSVGSVISLTGFVSIGVTTATGSITLGLLAAVGVGVAFAILSVFSIMVIKIPPIVATLASGLIATSFTLSMADGFTGFPDPRLRAFLNLRLLGVSVLAVLVILLTVVVVLALRYFVVGRSLLAVGQNQRAAGLAGVPATRIVASTYLVSGALAGLTGALLATYIAPTADLGTTYLLDSIAVVVIGGTLISGGRAVPGGIWGGALFLILLGALLNLVGWSIAGQNVLKGVLLLAVLFFAGGGELSRRRITKPDEGTPTTSTEAPTPAATG